MRLSIRYPHTRAAKGLGKGQQHWTMTRPEQSKVDLERGGDQTPDTGNRASSPPRLFPTTAQGSKAASNSRTNQMKVEQPRTNHTNSSNDASFAQQQQQPTTTLDVNGRRQTNLLYALVCISLLVIGAVIAVGVVVAGRRRQRGTDRTTAARQQQMSDIVASVVANGTALADPTSPQAQARHWLLFDDDRWVDPSLAMTRNMVVQRYVLSVFYYATGGPTSWMGNNWLHGRECDQTSNHSWTGISCSTNDQVLALALGE